MYELEVIWGEGKDPIAYSFIAKKEAEAFQKGILVTKAQFPDTLGLVQIHVTRWGISVPASPWFRMFYAIFIGGWTTFWWYLFRDSEIAVEYLLVGLVSSLLSYITIVE